MSGGYRPIRVLSCIKCLGYGGAERLLVSAAEARSAGVAGERFEHEVAYVLPSKRSLVPELEAAGVPVHCLGSGDSNLDLRWARRLRDLLLGRPYDVVHFHLPYTAAVGRLVVASLPARARPAMVTTEHNVWSSYPLLVRWLNRLTMPLDAAVLAVSQVVKEAVPVRHRRRVEVVVHGPSAQRLAEAEPWRAEVRAELGVAPGEVLVGTVANLRPGKGYDVLLPAARSLLDRGLPVRFAAVGVGPLEAEVAEQHRRLALGDRFLLLGGRGDAVRVLAAFDVFVLPSEFEGLPVALMEAMALGVPVVTTAVGGIPEFVSHRSEGLLVTPRRQEELVDALAELIGDGEARARMGAAARATGSRFDVAHAVRRTDEIYEEVVALAGRSVVGRTSAPVGSGWRGATGT